MRYFLFFMCIIYSLPACKQKENKIPTSIAQSMVTVADTGWINLFDGKTLKSWHTYGEPTASAAWRLDSGAIHLDASKKEDDETVNGGDLITDDVYENFDLKLEWKISRGGNSGIKFYVQEDTLTYPDGAIGPEMQVLDNERHPDGRTAKHRAADLYDLLASYPQTVKVAGEWNYAEIKCNNGQLEFYLNGPKVLSTTLWDRSWQQLIAHSKYRNMPGWGSFKTGHIALQDHRFDVWYRNIMIRKL
jgi:hypothetical protein